MQDDYVLSKQAQMLTDAGVDTVVLDLSNFRPVDPPTNYYKDDWLNMMKVWNDIRQRGEDAPQVVFLAPFDLKNSAAFVEYVYKDLYSQNIYSDLWFRWDGKPLIMANSYHLSDDLKNFFTFRSPNPGYNGGGKGSWGWLSNFPQRLYGTGANPNEEITVSVAQNSNATIAESPFVPMTTQDSDGNYIARGRSFRYGAEPLSKDPLSPDYPSEYGYNFAEQWGRTLELAPPFVFVTGWNEWTAARFEGSGFNVFVDQFNQEFSRDIEPMKGGHFDNYYNQLVDFIRKYKGARQTPVPDNAVTIAIDGDFRDWDQVSLQYLDDRNDIIHRNSKGFGNAGTYTDEAACNKQTNEDQLRAGDESDAANELSNVSG